MEGLPTLLDESDKSAATEKKRKSFRFELKSVLQSESLSRRYVILGNGSRNSCLMSLSKRKFRGARKR
jgi:hypothetical protein